MKYGGPHCCGLNLWVPPAHEIHMLEPNAQCVIRKWEPLGGA